MSSSVSSQRDDILSILRNVNSNKNFDKTEDEETLGMRIETKDKVLWFFFMLRTM